MNNTNLKAVITIGVSASGKSTWAKQFISEDLDNSWAIVCRDDIRAALMGGVLDWKKWNFRNEDKVTINYALALRQNRDLNKNLILADTNLNPIFLQDLKVKLIALGYDVELKVFEIDTDEAVRRDSLRGPLAVGKAVIEKQCASFDRLKKSGVI